MGLAGPGPTTRKSSLSYNSMFFLSSSYIVSSCQFCTDWYCAVSATYTTQCFHVRSSHVHTQNVLQRPQVDLAVKRWLKRVWVSILVFYARWSANSLRVSTLCAGGGKLLPPTPTPLLGPTTLQILAMPLSRCGRTMVRWIPQWSITKHGANSICTMYSRAYIKLSFTLLSQCVSYLHSKYIVLRVCISHNKTLD